MLVLTMVVAVTGVARASVVAGGGAAVGVGNLYAVITRLVAHIFGTGIAGQRNVVEQPLVLFLPEGGQGIALHYDADRWLGVHRNGKAVRGGSAAVGIGYGHIIITGRIGLNAITGTGYTGVPLIGGIPGGGAYFGAIGWANDILILR